MKTNTKKGFTLIELLVVIAIIGILSSVVLASLNTARNKGADAAIKGNLSGIRAQAELEYDTNNDYDTVCGANGATQNTQISQAMAAATNAGSGSVVCGEPASGAANAWALSAQLKANTAQYFCVDSTGKATTTASQIAATAVVCP